MALMEVANGLGNVPACSQPAVPLTLVCKLSIDNGALLTHRNPTFIEAMSIQRGKKSHTNPLMLQHNKAC